MNNLFTESMNWNAYSSIINKLDKEWPYERVIQIPGYANTTLYKYNLIKSYAYSLQSYYSALPLDVDAMDNGNRQSQLVVSCQIDTWDHRAQPNCSEWVKLRWDPTYYLCYSISVPEQLTQVCTVVLI